MADDILCKVKCFDGYLNTLVYPKPIPRGGEAWVTEEVAMKMQRSQTAVRIVERKLKINKPKTRRKKADGEET